MEKGGGGRACEAVRAEVVGWRKVNARTRGKEPRATELRRKRLVKTKARQGPGVNSNEVQNTDNLVAETRRKERGALLPRRGKMKPG